MGLIDDIRKFFGIKTGEELAAEWRAKNPNVPAATDPETGEPTGNYKLTPTGSAGSGEATPIFTDIFGKNQPGKKVDCKHECGSLFSPVEWGCYTDKMMGRCGGSTGLCDLFGSGEWCLSYGKYILVGIVLAIVVLILTRRKSWRRR